MDDPSQLSVEQLTRSIETGASDDVAATLEAFEAASTDDRKAAVRAVRDLAAAQPNAVGAVLPALTPFLTDDERSVRLTTAKLFVAVAREAPSAVVPCIDALTDRLADEAEFYYVRARSAEALGYVAFEHPDEAASPELLADLQVGLSFDETEVREKLAKAMAYVALGNPGRLRHQTDSIAAHLDDENELVRYHLCTALVVVGCAFPEALSAAASALAARLDDESPFVRGRAAEAMGLLADAELTAVTADDLPDSEEEQFAAERVQFAREALAGAGAPEGVGSVDAVRESIDGAAEEIRAPDGERDCPHCGLSVPANGPPTCPRCGTPC